MNDDMPLHKLTSEDLPTIEKYQSATFRNHVAIIHIYNTMSYSTVAIYLSKLSI